jgi:hypothetical protein
MKTEKTFIIHPETSEQVQALKAFAKALKLKFEQVHDPYSPEFVEKIKKSRRQFQEGKGRIITLQEIDETWK